MRCEVGQAEPLGLAKHSAVHLRRGWATCEQNDVLGLLEVMKMFNPIRAEFPGTAAYM